MAELRSNKAEIEFLTLSYNRFYDIFEEVLEDSFWEKDSWYRFSKIKEVFAVYSELLHYEPINWVIEQIKEKRPPMEAEIGSELFKFIRNIVIHMPLFESWDDVWFNKNIINWYKKGQFIDKFLRRYKGHEPVKYRFWEARKRKMTYISINFPNEYENNEKIFLKNILSEKEGIKISLIFMKKIIDTQIDPS